MQLKSESEVTQSCLTPSDPMDRSPPGSSIHGIFQARVLEWGAIAFSDTLSHLSLKQSYTASGIVILILQIMPLKLREIKRRAEVTQPGGIGWRTQSRSV